MTLKKWSSILGAVFMVLSPGLAVACGGSADFYPWLDWANKPYFFSLAALELAEGEADFCRLGADSEARREMLAGWFDIIEGLPRTEQAAADLSYLLREAGLGRLEALKTKLSYGLPYYLDYGGVLPFYSYYYEKENSHEKGNNPANLAEKAIVLNKNFAALNYLVFLRELEDKRILGYYADDDWSYQPPKKKKQAENSDEIFESFIARAQAAYQNQKNPELKWRYALQLTRLYFYRSDYQALNNFFEMELRLRPPHPAKEWCRSYYGGSLAAQGRLTEALGEFALVFNRSAWYRNSAWLSFKAIQARGQVKSYGRSEDDKDALVKNALEADGKRYGYESLWAELERIRAGGEPPVYLENLVADFIGRLEWRYYKAQERLSQEEEGEGAPPSMLDMEKALTILAPRRPVPAFWHLAAAHLAILRGAAGPAEEHIRRAVRAGAERRLPRQLALTRFLKAARLEPLDSRLENKLGRWLASLDARRLKGANLAASDYEGLLSGQLEEALRGLLETVLAARYRAAGRHDRAFFCLAVSNDWLGGGRNGEDGSPEDFFHVKESLHVKWARDYVGLILSDPAALKSVRRTLEAPSGPLEKFFIRYVAGWTPDVITEFTGLAHIRRHEFKAAVRELAGLESRRQEWARSRYQAKTPANPFRLGPERLYGQKWRDDFKNFFEAAGRAGLGEDDLKTLERLIAPPATFYGLAVQAAELRVLSAREDEMGWTSVYFYNRALENIDSFYYYTQRCYNCYYSEREENYRPMSARLFKTEGWPYSGRSLEEALRQAGARSQNPELAARAAFQSAYESPPLATKSPMFSFFYRRLNERYAETEFYKALNFNCPEARRFLDFGGRPARPPL